MPSINIGKGSSNYYCNLIKSYLKNHEHVSVVSGGHRMNVGVWVFHLIGKDFLADDLRIKYTQDERTHTSMEFVVYNKKPVFVQPKGVLTIP